MELTDKEKERIVAEEKARLEARAEFMHEHWHGCGGGWHGRHRGFGLFKLLFLGAVLFAAFHCWHRPYGSCGGYGYGAPVPPPAASAPAPQPSANR